jgi:hypothetical protein
VARNNRKNVAENVALAGLRLEMAIPRSAASAARSEADQPGNGPVPQDSRQEFQNTAGSIISDFTGVYQRIARKLNVSPSMVSKVASGSRRSLDIEAALRDELKGLKKRLAHYS